MTCVMAIDQLSKKYRLSRQGMPQYRTLREGIRDDS
jgi:hypothetical protein